MQQVQGEKWAENAKQQTPRPEGGSLHTALRKAKRHVGCQTQMYFRPAGAKA